MVTQIVHINRKFYAASMKDADLMQHLTHMTYLSEQLPEMNEEISSKKFPRVALGSLPESYNNFLMNYDSGAERLQLSLAKCRRSLFQSRANTGQPNHMRLCTVMYVAQCKWNQKVVVDTCLPSH